MRKNLAFALVVGFAAALVMASQCSAGKYNKKLNVGDAAPQWSGAAGIDDKKHALADHKDAKAVVVVFTCNHCPVADFYDERLVQLQKDYKVKGVQLVAISVSTMEADKLPKMKEKAETKKFNFPYLHDETQKVGRDFGATATPQVFVLGADRKIAYMGAIDDSWADPAEVKNAYLRDALDAVLAGKPPAVTETKPKGCGIEYE